jgi:hypothetical protein
MTNRSTLAATAAATLTAAMLVIAPVEPGSRSASPTAPPGDGSPADIPELLDVPQGPFDPVLTQEAPAYRSLAPANHVVNNPAGDQSSSVQSEVAIFAAGDEIVIGWNDAMGFFGSGSLTGFGYSADRGNTWQDGGSLPDGGGSDIFGDPTVTRTNDGVWLMASIDLGGPNGIAINRGTFNGGTLSFGPPVRFSDSGQFLDKEYFEHDPVTDRVYLTYVGSSFKITHSDDDGLTWSTPTVVNASEGGNGAYPAVGNDGEVYVSWVAPLGVGNANIRMRYSPNGGATFPNPAVTVLTLGPQSGQAPTCFNRSFNITFPSMDIDRSNGPHRGRAYITWCDGARNTYNAYLAYSDDKGQTWSAPVQLNDNDNDATTEQFWPQMHVSDLDGRIVVGWYDRRNDTGGASLCDYYCTMSVDGGLTWGPNRRMSNTSVAWCGVPADIAPNFGDYTEVTIDDRSVFAAWSDARLGTPDVVTSRFDDRHDLAVTGDLATLAPVSGDGVAWLMPNEAEVVLSPSSPLETNAQMALAAIGLGLLATPQETEGVFDIAGEDVEGSLTLSSEVGTVAGSVSLARTSPSAIDFSFTATADPELGSISLPAAWTSAIRLEDNGPNTVRVTGTVTMPRPLGAIVFDVDGLLTMDGALGESFGTTHSWQQTARLSTGSDLTLHTRTLVDDAGVVAVEPVQPSGNPFPFVALGAAPNPVQASTRITISIDRATTGSLRVYNSQGQLVRTIAEGAFESGDHAFAFDGKDGHGRDLVPGGYFVRFKTSFMTAHKKLFIVR